jgi:hypothetical protein
MASETNSLSKVRFGVTNRINRDDDDGGESMEERLWILLGFDAATAKDGREIDMDTAAIAQCSAMHMMILLPGLVRGPCVATVSIYHIDKPCFNEITVETCSIEPDLTSQVKQL